MAKYIVNRLNFALNRFDHAIGYILGNRFPPGALCTVDLGHHDAYSSKIEKVNSQKSVKDIISEAFLWAVPKTRRSIETRMSRRFGHKEHFWKPLVPKTNLLPCTTCGHYHEAARLCHNCYTRVKTETTEMQEAIVNNLKLEPVEQDVVVLYAEEKKSKNEEYWKGQRIVELPKPRPAWFHSNLLQPTTQEPSESAEVKPVELA